ncbi:Transposase and inactivated derivatives [uncultured Candidatus Thioglobus sp.]|nr:Transposase and inactivated derivatives [uncultured Candidatus Thioglobus sp.]
MPRQARSVFANIPHHITQRGNRRGDVFFCDADKDYYLQLLQEYTLKHGVAVLAYCLMTNHIHLILQPTTVDGLQKVLKPLHMRYS